MRMCSANTKIINVLALVLKGYSLTLEYDCPFQGHILQTLQASMSVCAFVIFCYSMIFHPKVFFRIRQTGVGKGKVFFLLVITVLVFNDVLNQHLLVVQNPKCIFILEPHIPRALQPV